MKFRKVFHLFKFNITTLFLLLIALWGLIFLEFTRRKPDSEDGLNPRGSFKMPDDREEFFALLEEKRAARLRKRRANHHHPSLVTSLSTTTTTRKVPSLWKHNRHKQRVSRKTAPATKPPPKPRFQMNQVAKEYRVKEVDCAAVYKNSTPDIQHAVNTAKQWLKDGTYALTEEFYLNNTRDCQQFIKTRGYITSSLSEEEEQFPIAFSIVAYRDIELLERFLRIIYRPQNVYCVHIDQKAFGRLHEAMASIAKCFSNVFMAPRRVSVSWGEFSVLEPELICMEALWRYRWKYFINLTGQEFPLKTNYELVKILTAYNGANDVEGTILRSNPERWNKTVVPPGITVVKGSMKVAINRDMVDYILHNTTGQAVVSWLKTFCDVCVPDEQLFSTLNHNPQLGIQGAYTGVPETDNTMKKPFLARFVNWGHEHIPCAGKKFRGVCILSTGDLPVLKSRRELFANKFYIKSRYGDRVVVGCMEERLFNRTRAQYLGRLDFDTSYYERLGFVRNQVLRPTWHKDAVLD